MRWPDNNIQVDQDLYIRELQTFLRAIAFQDKRIPLIAIDGIYGPETTAAVSAFQEANDIPVTGTVDLKTWEMLYLEYLLVTQKQAPPVGVLAFPGRDFILQKGDSGDAVYVLQVMLNTLSRTFSNLPAVLITGEYDENTARAVQAYQLQTKLSQNGEVDKTVWDHIARSYNSYHESPAPIREQSDINPFSGSDDIEQIANS